MKQRKGWRISCDVGKATEGLENELWRRWSDKAHSPNLLSLPTSQLILQPFRCFTYVIAHFPTLFSLLLCHSSFSNPSFASPTSQALHLRHLASRPWASVKRFQNLSRCSINATERPSRRFSFLDAFRFAAVTGVSREVALDDVFALTVMTHMWLITVMFPRVGQR